MINQEVWMTWPGITTEEICWCKVELAEKRDNICCIVGGTGLP